MSQVLLFEPDSPPERPFIVGHMSVDWDVITALWLGIEYDNWPGLILLPPSGLRNSLVLHKAHAVADNGGELDWSRCRYDHHHLGDGANLTCATYEVFKHLHHQRKAPEFMEPIIQLVLAGDTGHPSANQSRQIGMHAALTGLKLQGKKDPELLHICFNLLSGLKYGIADQPDVMTRLLIALDQPLFRHAIHTAQAARLLPTQTLYSSQDGRVRVIT